MSRTWMNRQRGTAELIAFQKKSGVFHEILSQPGLVTPIAWKLFQEGVISQHVRDDIINIMLSDSQRASKLLSAVEKAIATRFWKFNNVCEVLSECEELKDVVEQMTVETEKYEGTPSEPNLPWIVPEDQSDIGIKRPCWESYWCCGISVCLLALVMLLLGIVLAEILLKPTQSNNQAETRSSPGTDSTNFAFRKSDTVAGILDSSIFSHSKTFKSKAYDLPSAPQPFVGRERKLKEVISDLMDKSISIIGIHGPPGFGKSALAVHVGHRLVSSKISVRYIDMNEFSLLKPQVSVNIVIKDTLNGNKSDMQKYESGELTFVKLSETSYVPLKSSKLKNSYQLLEWARRIRTATILVLDNCDEILNHAQNDFQVLIKEMIKLSLRNLKFIMTSQQNIMFVDNFAPHNVSELSLSAAELLLRNLTNVAMTNSEVKDLSELVGFCPLTLKVAAKLLGEGMYSLSFFVETLRADLSVVLSNKRFPENERFMVLMDLAFQRLSFGMQDCFYQVSLFPGSFSSEAALSISDCDEVLSELVDRSLLEQYVHMNTVRYSMHKLIKNSFEQLLKTTYNNNFGFYYQNEVKQVFNSTFRDYYTSLTVRYSQLLSKGNITAAKHLMNIDKHNFDNLLNMILNDSKGVTNVSEAVVIIVAYRENVLADNVILSSYLSFLKSSPNQFMSVCNIVGSSTCLRVFAKLNLETQSFSVTSSCSLTNSFRAKSLEVYNTATEENQIFNESLPEEFIKFFNTLNHTNCVCTLGFVMSRVACLLALLITFFVNVPYIISERHECISLSLLPFVVCLRIIFWVGMFFILLENRALFSPYVFVLLTFDFTLVLTPLLKTMFVKGAVFPYSRVRIFYLSFCFSACCGATFCLILFNLKFVLPQLCNGFDNNSESVFLKISLSLVSVMFVIVSICLFFIFITVMDYDLLVVSILPFIVVGLTNNKIVLEFLSTADKRYEFRTITDNDYYAYEFGRLVCVCLIFLNFLILIVCRKFIIRFESLFFSKYNYKIRNFFVVVGAFLFLVSELSNYVVDFSS